MAAPKAFRKRGGGTEESFQIQSAVETALTPLSSTIINGTLIEGVLLTTSPTNISHKLGRTYRGYIVCKSSAPATVSNATSEDDTLFIKLTASAATTVSLWVF